MVRHPRVLIVAEHASALFGGEAALPLYYFRYLRERGVDTRLVVHERTRAELDEVFLNDRDRITYIRDTFAHRALFALGNKLPRRIDGATTGVLLRLLTQLAARPQIAQLIHAHQIDVLHQPIPVSPKEPSLLFGLGVPVVMGPMNGGMNYPAAFRNFEPRAQLIVIELSRYASHLVHFCVRGKLEATTLLVANLRTRDALPKGIRGKVELLVENGVDLRVFGSYATARRTPRTDSSILRVAFIGRLVDWKMLDVAIEAMARIRDRVSATLDVLGDGPMRPHWEMQTRNLRLEKAVRFHGFVPQDKVAEYLANCDTLVLPSVYECGGAVILEAMAMGLPVVATAWGGPMDYLDSSTGYLIDPSSRESLVAGIADALCELAMNPDHRVKLGELANKVVVQRFDWRHKVDRMLEIYDEAITRFAALNKQKRPEVA